MQKKSFKKFNHLVSGSLLTSLLLLPVQAALANEPLLFEGGGFSDNLLDQVECRHLKRSTPMSINPVNPKLGKTTALDRQFLIQMRMFKCFPTLNHDAELAIRHPDVKSRIPSSVANQAIKILTTEVLTKSEKKAERRSIREARRAYRQALEEARERGEKAPKYNGPKKTKTKQLTDFTGPFGIRKYFGQLNLVLFEGDKKEYNPADSAYPWIWPAKAMLTVERAVKLVRNAGVNIEPYLPFDSRDVLSRAKQHGGAGVAPKDQLLRPNSVFFSAPLPAVDPGLSSEQRREMANRLIWQFYAVYWEYELAEACAKQNGGTPCAEYRAIADIKKDMQAVGRDAIALQVTDLRLLRRQSHEATWCQHAKNGGVPCPGYFPQAYIDQRERELVAVCGHLGLPLMTPFTTRIHKSAMDPGDLCDLLQRADNAHREWVRGVRAGHTVKGFVHTWTSGIGHGVIRADGALPFDLELDTGESSTQGGRFSKAVFDLRDANLGGIAADGSCPLGPVENNNPL